MDWNLGAMVTLGLAFIGSIVWIIRLEGEVKMLKAQILGETGLVVMLRNIDAKLTKVSDTVIEVKQDLKDLRREHDKKTCSNYKSSAMDDGM